MRIGLWCWAFVVLGGVACAPKKPPDQTSDAVVVVKAGMRIQDAIDATALEKTQILVEPGEYTEKISFRSGIHLKSTVALGAVIRHPALVAGETVVGWGVKDVTLEGFDIRGAIHFSQKGNDFTQPTERLKILRNRISEVGTKDAIKISHAIDFEISENDVSGSTAEQGIDMVAAKRFRVTKNKVHDIKNRSGMCIVAKGGSLDGEISENEVSFCGNAAIACGQVSDEIVILPEGLAQRYEAKQIVVAKNRIHDHEKMAILVMGAKNCTIQDNEIGASVYYTDIFVGGSSMTHNPAWISEDIQILQPRLLRERIDLEAGQKGITLNGQAIEKSP